MCVEQKKNRKETENMRLDINRIAALEKEIAELKAKEKEIYSSDREMEFGEFYKAHRNELHEIKEQIDTREREISIIHRTNVNVGDGISMSPWTDWKAFTVIARKDTPKGFTLTVQRDKAIRTDSNGMSDDQAYRFERDPEGYTRTIRWNPRSNCFSADGYKVCLGRHEYYDPSF